MALAPHEEPIRFVYVHARVVRRIATIFPGIHVGQTEALLLARTWFDYFERDSGAIKRIVDWTGANPKWKRKVTKQLALCVQNGVMNTKPSKRGTAIYVSEKGKRILELYEQRYQEVIEEYIGMRGRNIKIKKDKILARKTPGRRALSTRPQKEPENN